jgi:hypothetical protein
MSASNQHQLSDSEISRMLGKLMFSAYPQLDYLPISNLTCIIWNNFVILYSFNADINDEDEDVILHEGGFDGIESMEFNIPIVEDVIDELLLEAQNSSQQSSTLSESSMEISSQDSSQSVSSANVLN